MGKTTLLFFIKNADPAHVLPIYIYLERAENEYGTNLWDYIVEEILRETGTEAPSLGREARHSDLILLAQEICRNEKAIYSSSYG